MSEKVEHLCKNCLEKHFPIWLVWDIDITSKEASLRAVTTTKERAEKYKKRMQQSHKNFDNHHFVVELEARDANHAYGIKVIERLGVELKRQK